MSKEFIRKCKPIPKLDPVKLNEFIIRFKKDAGCWVWIGSLRPNGYGIFYFNGKLTAHRVSYEVFNGPIPDGLVVNHKCRNRRCVNPDHLNTITDKENVLNGVGISVVNAKKTHCKYGHPFNKKNTYIKSDGARACVPCGLTRAKRYRQNRPPLKSKYIGINYDRSGGWRAERCMNGKTVRSSRLKTEADAVKAYKRLFGVIPTMKRVMEDAQ